MCVCEKIKGMAKSILFKNFWPTEKGLRYPIGSFKSISEKIAESDLQQLDARVKSFHFCPGLDPARAKELAEAGLYFTGKRHDFVFACAGCKFSYNGPIATATNLIDLHAFGSSIGDSEDVCGCPFVANVAAAAPSSFSKEEGKAEKKKKKKKKKKKTSVTANAVVEIIKMQNKVFL